MPALPDQHIFYKTPDRAAYFDEKVKASVTTTGEFSVGIPNSLYDIAADRSVRIIPGEKRLASFDFGTHGIARIKAKRLEDALAYLKECAKEYLEAEIKTERVIAYTCDLKAAFWIDEKGEIHSNGQVSGDEEDRSGDWWSPRVSSGISSFNRTHKFSIGLAAAVYDRITSKRVSGESVEWFKCGDYHPEHHETTLSKLPEPDPEILLLNGFRCLQFDPGDSGTRNLKTMAYTPARAMFFYDTMRALCRMAKGMDEFFSQDQDAMERLIDNGSVPRLMAPKPSLEGIRVRTRSR